MKVRLRPIELQDLPALYLHQIEPDAVRMAVVNPRSPEGFDAHWRKVLENTTISAQSILADDALVGYITCFKLEGEDTIGYWLAKEYWGRGIATRALELMLELVTVRPLYARVAKHNAASLRVLERCGFVVTGCRWMPAEDRYPASDVVFLELH